MPEVAVYSYPHFADAQRLFGKQRTVLLLDVMDKLYTNSMRQIAVQRLDKHDEASLITLKSTLQYLCHQLELEHRHFHLRDEFDSAHTAVQGLFVRLASMVQCVEGIEGIRLPSDEQYGCLLSGYMFNVVEGIVRGNPHSLLLIAFLEKEGLVQWTQRD